MKNAEMTRRLNSIPESERLSMYRDAKAGNSAFAVAGYSRAGLKNANAVFAWIKEWPHAIPSDESLDMLEG